MLSSVYLTTGVVHQKGKYLLVYKRVCDASFLGGAPDGQRFIRVLECSRRVKTCSCTKSAHVVSLSGGTL